eukprot:6161776-Lingulodinium_polyedra.AAC.1
MLKNGKCDDTTQITKCGGECGVLSRRKSQSAACDDATQITNTAANAECGEMANGKCDETTQISNAVASAEC